uniref:signal recognition particle 14 kDa protein isoform X1 n=1 Tax=Nyctereutes procyonoides TaxID=34880 RepID=UPI002443AEAD|nr:signal recognition particle 14 kDa protein isoform X1 [Nyctereutes procyonoides]
MITKRANAFRALSSCQAPFQVANSLPLHNHAVSWIRLLQAAETEALSCLGNLPNTQLNVQNDRSPSKPSFALRRSLTLTWVGERPAAEVPDGPRPRWPVPLPGRRRRPRAQARAERDERAEAGIGGRAWKSNSGSPARLRRSFRLRALEPYADAWELAAPGWCCWRASR